MKRPWAKFLWLTVLLVSYSGPAVPIEQPKAYWLWNKEIPEAALGVETLYAFHGIFDVQGGKPVYRFQGVIPRQIAHPSVGIVPTYRLNRLVPPAMIASRFVAHRRAWERRGARVTGIQIDYDSPTSRLPDYARWLVILKKTIGEDLPVSITGLGDWLLSAREGDLKTLAGQVSFIAFMMYHKDRPLGRLEDYTKKLAKYSQPFFLGRLSNQMTISAFRDVRRASGYRGDIVFPHRKSAQQ